MVVKKALLISIIKTTLRKRNKNPTQAQRWDNLGVLLLRAVAVSPTGLMTQGSAT